jgi:signal transduction histidine kinase
MQEQPVKNRSEGDDIDLESVSPSISSLHSLGSVVSLRTKRRWSRNPLQIALSILILGLFATTAFLILGMTSAAATQEKEFSQMADTLMNQMRIAWMDYEVAGLWTHQACTSMPNMTHVQFRELYEQISSTGIDVQIEFLPFVLHEDRPRYEERMRSFLQEYYPYVDYQGFVGLEPIDENGNLDLLPRSDAEFYYPIHFMEPIPGSEPALDLDVYSRPRAKFTIDAALETWKPAVSEPAKLVEETVDHAYSVFLFHPGTPISTQPMLETRDLSLLVIRIPDLVDRTIQTLMQSTELVMYDTTEGSNGEEFFLGRVAASIDSETRTRSGMVLPPLPLPKVRETHRLKKERVMSIADRKWTVVVVATEGTYKSELGLVITGAVLIFICSLAVAVGVLSKLKFADERKESKLRAIKEKANKERAALVLEHAQKATKAERTLNDFIAHEVRNPVASAMAATAFIRTELSNDEPLKEASTLQSVREDVEVVDNSLNFINDLLRNMLDMHRAASKQLKIEKQFVDIYIDVLKPVESMLHRRGSNIEVIVECTPPDLIVHTDVLRLKQVLLNLGRNSSKFIEQARGFIYLSAAVVNGSVHLSVADTGLGIPLNKRSHLFEKFQESLDSLNQGTGIGLSLCKNLVELMGGEIYLDEEYDSGIQGYPGARFVIDLKIQPSTKNDFAVDHAEMQKSESPRSRAERKASFGLKHPSSGEFLALSDESGVSVEIRDNDFRSMELPPNLSVLFVDDDGIIRRLFCRALENAAPSWSISQAANGETALQLVKEKKSTESSSFDILFIDQYMASGKSKH